MNARETTTLESAVQNISIQNLNAGSAAADPHAPLR